MRRKGQTKPDLLAALASVSDIPLMDLGYKRNKRSTFYTKNIEQARHTIFFTTDFSPMYEADAEAHIHPMIRIQIPSVTEKALELVDGNRMLRAGAPEIFVNQPIEFTAPKNCHMRWFTYGPEDYAAVVKDIVAFLLNWAIPFLEQFTSPFSIVDAYNRGEDRLMWQQHTYVDVAAAFCLCEQPEKAREVIKEKLGAPGLKRRYAVVFEQIERMLE